MRTITEFSGFTIKSAAQARAKLGQEGVPAEQLAERLGAEVAVTGDRLARLMEALDAVGDAVERVRLVRVFPASDEPRGSKQVGEFKYLIDLQPHADKGGKRDERRGRGDRGGERGGGGRGGDRGGGGGRGGGGRGGGDRGPGGFKPRQPMGLKSLTKAAKQGTPGEAAGPGGREEREERGPMPSVGQGWMLTRAPGDPRDHKRRGKGPRKGKPPRGRAGDQPGDQKDRRDRKDRPRGPRPQGPRPPHAGAAPHARSQPGQPGQPGQPAAPGQPGDAERKRRRRRRRGRGGPRPPQTQAPQAGGPETPAPQTQAAQAAQAPETPAPSRDPAPPAASGEPTNE